MQTYFKNHATCCKLVVLGLAGYAALPVAAAPLDVFLTATPEQIAPSGYLELVSDHMNESLDFFKVRDSDPQTAGTKAGNYQGTYLSGAVRLFDKTWLSGTLGQRSVSSTSDTYNYTNWQVSGLYRFLEQNGKVPAMALRLSAWGNYASATESTTAVVVPGAKLNTAKITEPADRQWQADWVGTWNLSSASTVSAFIGVGKSQLSYGELTATTAHNGCNYNVTFYGNDIYGILIRPCMMGGAIVEEFYDSSGEYGVDVAREIAWNSNFAQAGINGTWQHAPWTLQAGYLLHVVNREGVDQILADRSKPFYTKNHNLTLQANYRIRPGWSIFGRAQLTSNLFFNDIPVSYNSSTSERFGSRYSIFSLGLRAEF